VHYVHSDWAIDDPAQLGRWQEHDPAEVWSAYCQRLAAAAGAGLFDILGHLDLPKKFGFRLTGDPAPLFAPVLAAAGRAGVAIELNTAGLRKDCREIYPSAALLDLAQRAGVGITFGSDAHADAEVGWAFDAAVDLARACGYTHTCRFERRQRRAVPL
jgi:histidinol-phosphatase (PHP family)